VERTGDAEHASRRVPFSVALIDGRLAGEEASGDRLQVLTRLARLLTITVELDDLLPGYGTAPEQSWCIHVPVEGSGLKDECGVRVSIGVADGETQRLFLVIPRQIEVAALVVDPRPRVEKRRLALCQLRIRIDARAVVGQRSCTTEQRRR
jgi:hypothetical protein